MKTPVVAFALLVYFSPVLFRLDAAAQSACSGPTGGVRRDVSFSFTYENDTFHNSDTSYTNGVRAGWEWRDCKNALVTFSKVNAFYPIGWLFRRSQWLSDRFSANAGELNARACEQKMERSNRQLGPCTTLSTSLAQLMYTPDSLAATVVNTHDQPYAGFLYATLGVTTADAPVLRNPKSWLGYIEASNQLILGVTGKYAFAKETQSWAHWTLATGSGRPLGWATQLASSPQIGILSEVWARPKKLEFCHDSLGCDGSEAERRWLDVTTHSEVVTSTHMVRLSQGLAIRLGAHFPDHVGMLRIPVGAPSAPATRKSCFAHVVCERFWYYLFYNVEARYVPYNMFFAGGLADGGPDGWRTIRQIEPRQGVIENAFGLAVGNRRMTLRGQSAIRTSEYDVIGRPRSAGTHGFFSATLSIHPPSN